MHLKHCENERIVPENTIRLHCEPSFHLQYKFQELLIGQCPTCHSVVMGWVGQDQEGNYDLPVRAIKPKKHERWYARIFSDVAHYFDPAGVDIVKGSSHQIPYQLRNVPVFR